MNIKIAQKSDIDIVKDITHTTIKEIYPHYYANGAVEFFLNHHNAENIKNDISKDCVFLCYDREQNAVGTVTINKNEICRLFVLSQHQGKGYGTKLIDFAEEKISENYDKIVLDASLPAKKIYLKRQYTEISYNIIDVENGDKLCYSMMQKISLNCAKLEF